MISNVQYEEKYRVESQFGLIKINFRGNVEGTERNVLQQEILQKHALYLSQQFR